VAQISWIIPEKGFDDLLEAARLVVQQDPSVHFVMAGYAAADIVCQVSRWEEAFGCVIAEAMAGGRPVVGTRAGAIAELVRDGETGFLVDRRARAQIAAKILELVRDPGLRQRFGEGGRRLAIEKDGTRNPLGRIGKQKQHRFGDGFGRPEAQPTGGLHLRRLLRGHAAEIFVPPWECALRRAQPH
jgi:glycosyltransferase involved in cell wall biosynthesis